MKRGFVTETHVVVYCDSCGETYSENESEGICFDSVHQAVDYLNDRSAAFGWFYDGDQVICDGCRAADTEETDYRDLNDSSGGTEK